MIAPQPEALRAIRSWLRLEQTFAAFNQHLRETYGITGAQLAMLRIVAESESVTLAQLRSRLAMHPATLGQLVERLDRLGLVQRGVAPDDRRMRRVTVTEDGRRLLERAPLAGPVRLRSLPVDGARLLTLAQAFDDAISLFGLEEWAV